MKKSPFNCFQKHRGVYCIMKVSRLYSMHLRLHRIRRTLEVDKRKLCKNLMNLSEKALREMKEKLLTT